MIPIIKWSASFAIGYAAHQTSPLFDRWESQGAGAWSRLGRYSVGVVALSWAFAIMTDSHTTRGAAFRDLLASAVGVGAGVAAGYALDD